MKNLIALLLVLALLMGLVGCAAANKETVPAETPLPETVVPEEESAA